MKLSDRTGAIVAGKYRLDRVLGSGGMGTVYEATHVSVSRKFAVKLLHEDVANVPDAAERFMREAQAAAHIGHSSVVDVFDVGQDADGSLYMVMEKFEGISVAQRLMLGVLDVDEAIWICGSILKGLSAPLGNTTVVRLERKALMPVPAAVSPPAGTNASPGRDKFVAGASFVGVPYIFPPSRVQRDTAGIAFGVSGEIGYAITPAFVASLGVVGALGSRGKPTYIVAAGPKLSFHVLKPLWMGVGLTGGTARSEERGHIFSTDMVFGPAIDIAVAVHSTLYGEWIVSASPSYLFADHTIDNQAFFVPIGFGVRWY